VAWTTDDLVAAVRVRAQVPDEGEDSEPTDAEILRIAHEEMLSRFVGIIRSARENYLVTSEDIALVEGTQSYRVPRRAHANAIRDAWIVSPSGRMRALRQIDLTDGHYFGGETGEPAGYYLSGAKLVLEPTPSAAMAGYSLRVFFYRSPSRLVLTSECAEVALVSDDTIVVSYTDYVATQDRTGEPFDLVQAAPPFDVLIDGVDCDIVASSTAIAITSAIGTSVQITGGSGWTPTIGDQIVQGSDEVTVTGVTLPTIFNVSPGFLLEAGAATAYEISVTFDGSPSLSDVVEGDFVCDHMTTCVPQVPDALWPALVSAVAVQVRLHEADPVGASSEAIQRDEYIKSALASMQPRVDGRAKSIVNLGSALRRRRPF
jgi:hypothetical protein